MPNSRVSRPSGVALPGRMTLRTEGLQGLNIQVLEFPSLFLAGMNRLINILKETLDERDKNKRYFPWRRFNNLLLASSPSLTHGFEDYDKPNSTLKGRYALCVSTPNAPFQPPSPDALLSAFRICAQEWVTPFYTEGDDIVGLCDDWVDSLELPQNWQWRPFDVQEIVDHIDGYGGLPYNALPALLSTLLHGTTTCLKHGQQEHEINWRRVQGDGRDKTGLFVASLPTRCQYVDDSGRVKEGYFAYRIDFRAQTQVGRINESGESKPWIFLDVSCQRYPHDPLIKKNFGRDVSVLVGTHQERTPGFGGTQTSLPTLVRLQLYCTKSDEDYKYQFDEGLAKLLQEMKARALVDPQDILKAPRDFGRFDAPQSMDFGDEYYVVHAEGLKYGEKGRGSGHNVSTGFSFQERAGVVAGVLDHLKDVLQPDTPFETDKPAPKGIKAPQAMRSFNHFSKKLSTPKKQREELEATSELEAHSAKQRLKLQPKIQASLKQALGNTPLHILVAALDPTFRTELCQALRDIWLLGPDDAWPQGVTVQEATITHEEATLWDSLDSSGVQPRDKNFSDVMKNQERSKRRQWTQFLEKQFSSGPQGASRFVFVSLKNLSKQEKSLGIKGAVRAACASVNAASQMALESTALRETASAKKGRLQNAALDLVGRQIGALYGPPSDIYKWAGLESVADSLDVVAICRHTVQNKVHYALAVRLSSQGSVDVLLPSHANWIPYHLAGPELGRIFLAGRSTSKNNPINLSKESLALFVSKVFATIEQSKKPTVALIEAEVWRNKGYWPQLKNDNLGQQLNVLNFEFGDNKTSYQRDEHLSNLLGVVRLRSGSETPQYIPRDNWDKGESMQDFGALSGFIDRGVSHIPHYFSAARLPDTQGGPAGQNSSSTLDIYKLDVKFNVSKSGKEFKNYGSKIAFKHPQLIEMLPFFVHSDFNQDGGISLCRALHYLRTSPAWSMGNILSPYPMHLGHKLIEDQCCIVGAD